MILKDKDFDKIDHELRKEYYTRCLFPEFTASFSEDIVPVLKEEYGMSKIFRDNVSNFDKVTDHASVISGIIHQFWQETVWGDVDFMFVDMPPGTGDVPLTVFQSLPVDGIVIVTTPQDLVTLIVKKAVNMAKMMNVPIIGLVENMSYFVCPDCGKEYKIFGDSKIDEIAAELGVPVLAKLPIDPTTALLVDKGAIELADDKYIASAVDFISKLD
jgi:Mrp family chromosome partitioning ATPase